MPRKDLNKNRQNQWRRIKTIMRCHGLVPVPLGIWRDAYMWAPSDKLSASARLSVLSLSMIPQVACRTESSRQSPAVLFHNAYSRLPRRSVISQLQLITGSSSSNSANGTNKQINKQSNTHAHTNNITSYLHLTVNKNITFLLHREICLGYKLLSVTNNHGTSTSHLWVNDLDFQ